MRGLLSLWIAIWCLACTRPDAAQGDSAAADPALNSDPTTTPVADTTVGAGRTTLRRLNRSEYNNTVRDLLATTLRPGDDLPTDDLSFGFDNIADTLNTSSLHVETYLSAAETLIEEALSPSSPVRESIVSCDVDSLGPSCASEILHAFARRAFRRPASDAQIQRLLQFLDLAEQQGDTPTQGLKLALQSMLVSARFLFRVELDPELPSNEPWNVDDFELASRLSYFLWSSMPDETLLQKAEAGSLQNSPSLADEVARLLADPRSSELTENFVGQWLHLRAVSRHQPDLVKFPEFTPELGNSMERSTQLLFEGMLQQRLAVEELVTSQTLSVDASLAQLYGLAAPGGDGFVDVMAPAERGGGVLAHASVLMVTSEPGRTSPVKRGAWVLSNLLCSPPPPPPPNVEGLDEVATGEENLTVRQRLERHRTDPACAACHTLMDPIGFGLENFDAIGRFRTSDEGQPLDTTGTLPDGTTFSNSTDLGGIIAADPRFRRCVAQKLATYALGRGVDPTREPALVDALGAVAQDPSLTALITALVDSAPFRMRAPETGAL